MQVNQITGISAAQELLDTLAVNQETTPQSKTIEQENEFQNTLQQMVQDIDQLQRRLGESIQQLTVPEQTSFGQKMQTADTTYDLMMGVKSRLINAYQAITP